MGPEMNLGSLPVRSVIAASGSPQLATGPQKCVDMKYLRWVDAGQVRRQYTGTEGERERGSRCSQLQGICHREIMLGVSLTRWNREREQTHLAHCANWDATVYTDASARIARQDRARKTHS